MATFQPGASHQRQAGVSVQVITQNIFHLWGAFHTYMLLCSSARSMKVHPALLLALPVRENLCHYLSKTRGGLQRSQQFAKMLSFLPEGLAEGARPW